ncbi:MAG: hypothetical protein WC881_03000, partial [Elusimicrobiota bacterium]
MNKGRNFGVVFCGLFVVALYSYAVDQTGSKHSSSSLESEAGIIFNDPAHVLFFNYQSYLVKHGKDGETLETWQALSSREHFGKVAKGE